MRCAYPPYAWLFAADFRDRVAHHVLVDFLEAIWEPIFIHDSCACRTGKGVHAGVQRLQTFIRQATANGSRPAWYLQLDIRNFFMSIDKTLLFAMLEKKMSDPDALWLSRVLVFHDCTDNYVMKGDADLFERLPPHKTLFGSPPGKGLPIGNLNSQFFANVYLNALDQFVKHTLKCRWKISSAAALPYDRGLMKAIGWARYQPDCTAGRLPGQKNQRLQGVLTGAAEQHGQAGCGWPVCNCFSQACWQMRLRRFSSISRIGARA